MRAVMVVVMRVATQDRLKEEAEAGKENRSNNWVARYQTCSDLSFDTRQISPDVYVVSFD